MLQFWFHNLLENYEIIEIYSPQKAPYDTTTNIFELRYSC